MNRTERLAAIIEELRRAGSRGRTALWLADRFEISLRTIKRDLRALHDMDAGLVSDPGRGGGCRIDQTRVLPPLTFTPGEATAIAVALGAEPELPYRTEGIAALAKLLGAMTREQRAASKALAARLWIRGRGSRGRWASVLDEALRERLVVHLDYTDERGEVSSRRPVEPMAFARTRDHWHLLAWCRWREAGRWFRVDRVSGAWLTSERVSERDLHATFGEPPEDASPIELD